MIRLLVIAFGAVFAMLLIAQTIVPGASERPANAAVRSAPTPRFDDPFASLVLRRDSSGQFHLTAAVDGQDARFLVDTGADVVALTVAEAERLGLPFDAAELEPILRTASGVGYGKRIVLDRLEIADHELRDVPAIIVDGLDVNLLGQSALRQLGKVELVGDRMVIGVR